MSSVEKSGRLLSSPMRLGAVSRPTPRKNLADAARNRLARVLIA
jgi:hypothetical protein